MTTVRVQSVLLEAEGPLLVVLRDPVDSAWLGTAVERGADGDEYLCVPISAGRLAAVRHGEVDVRDVFVNPEISTPARVVVSWTYADQRFELHPMLEVPTDWIPDEGALLTEFIQPVSAEFRALASEATVHNRPVLHLNLNPPNSSAHAIDADLLGKALVLFQKSIRYANSAANRTLSAAAKKLVSGAENYTFEAFATAPSSFEVHLQAKMEADFFGYTPHLRALRKLDEIVGVMEDTEAAIAVAKENRGHFVSAIRSLMQFVADTNIPISYAWTAPQSQHVEQHTIRPEPARALYEQLVAKRELDRDEVDLVGVFHKIDDEYNTWRFETSDGVDYSGDLAPGTNFNLSGYTTTTVTYSIHCIEILRESEGTGRESTALQMTQPPKEVASP
jgi:hypothetical protein